MSPIPQSGHRLSEKIMLHQKERQSAACGRGGET